jgi:Zn-dependent alcohol dehydrogenase
VVVGIAPTGVEARIRAIDFSSEKTLRGSFYGSGHPAVEIAELARLVAERTIDLSRTVSHVTDLSGINEAFARMERGEGVRTVVQLENA